MTTENNKEGCCELCLAPLRGGGKYCSHITCDCHQTPVYYSGTTNYRESDLEWEDKKPHTTPTEEKESDATLWSSVIVLTITVFTLIGWGFLLYHSLIILGFVFKPWMQDDAHHRLEQEVAGLRYRIRQCADEEQEKLYIEYRNGKRVPTTSTTSTSIVSLQDCLKNL